MLAKFVETDTTTLANDMCLSPNSPLPNGFIEAPTMTYMNPLESSSEHCDMTSEDESVGNTELHSPSSSSAPMDLVNGNMDSPQSIVSNSDSFRSVVGRFFCVFCGRDFTNQGAARDHYSNLLLKGHENKYVEKWIVEFLDSQTAHSTIDVHFEDCPVCQILKTFPSGEKTAPVTGKAEDHVMRHLCYYPYQCTHCRVHFFRLSAVTLHIQRSHPLIINYNNYIEFHVIPEIEQLMDISKTLNESLCCFNCSDVWSDDLDSTLTSEPDTIVYSDANDDDSYIEHVGSSKFKLRHCKVIVEQLRRETVDRMISVNPVDDDPHEHFKNNYVDQRDQNKYVNRDIKASRKRRVKTMRLRVEVRPLQREEIEKYCNHSDSTFPFAYKLTRSNEAVNHSASLFQEMSLFDYNVGVPEYFYSLKSFIECNIEDFNNCADPCDNVSLNGSKNRKKLKIGFAKSGKKKKPSSYSCENIHASKGHYTKCIKYGSNNHNSVPQSDYSVYTQRFNPNEEAIDDELTKILERFLNGDDSDSEDDMSSIGPDIFSDDVGDVDDVNDNDDNSSLSSMPSFDDINSLTNGVMSSSLEQLTLEDCEQVMNSQLPINTSKESHDDSVNSEENGKSV